MAPPDASLVPAFFVTNEFTHQTAFIPTSGCVQSAQPMSCRSLRYQVPGLVLESALPRFFAFDALQSDNLLSSSFI